MLNAIRTPRACTARTVVPVPRTCAAKATAEPVHVTRVRTLEDLPVEKGNVLWGKMQEVFSNFQAENYFRKHDTDAFMMGMGFIGPPKLTLQDPELIREVLTKGEDVFAMEIIPSVQRIVWPEGKILYGPEQKKWRAAMGRVLAPEAIMHLQLPLIIEFFQERISELCQSGQETKWQDDARMMAFSVACRAVVGDVLSREDLEWLFPHAMATFNDVFYLSYGQKDGLPFTRYRRAVDARAAIITFLSGRLEAVLEERSAASVTSLKMDDSIIGRLLASLEEEGIEMSNTKKVTFKLAEQLFFFMWVGTDTTQYQLASAAQHLARYPEWLRHLNEEQDRLSADFGGDLGRKVISRSVVAQAVAQEIIRLTPTVNFLLRKAMCDTQLRDIQIPEGTSLFLAISPAIRATGNGNPNFDPAQWLNEDWTKCVPNKAPGNLSFGAGLRKCPGQPLAGMEAIVALCVYGREVGKVNMVQEESERKWVFTNQHPTGMPCSFEARK